MADTGKQSPLGINVYGSLLQNIGFWINPTAASYMGASKLTFGGYSYGKICSDTCLFWVTYAINDAFMRGATRCGAALTKDDFDTPGVTVGPFNRQYTPFSPPPYSTVNTQVYNNIVTIGQSLIPALGNSAPPTWETSDPSGVWRNLHTGTYSLNQAGAPATSGYGYYSWDDPVFEQGASSSVETPDITNRHELAYKLEGQNASWYPMLGTVNNNTTLVPNRAITQWGWVRTIALQAWQDYNFNNETRTYEPPEYRFFVDSFNGFYGFLKYTNDALYAVEDSKTFLKGTYSNQNDLISGDTLGVSLASRAFGQDLLNLGDAIDLQYIKTFGLPSNVLKILQKNKALTTAAILALLAAGLSQPEINDIANGNITPTKEQEQKIYGAMLVILKTDLQEILVILNCKTQGLESLADLVNIKKMFPLSYTTLTVPIYNTTPGPTNSKTYYLLFVGEEMNPLLVSPKIKEIVSTIVPPQPPPPVEQPPPPPIVSYPTVIAQPPNIPAPDTQPVVTQQPNVSGGGGCVALESYIPYVEIMQKHNGRDITQAWMIEHGVNISLGTDNLQIIEGRVSKALNDYQPCLRIITADGVSLVCSTTARILTKEQGFIAATELFGKRVAVMRHGRAWYDEVVGLEDVGMKFVRVIDAGDNSFWAGEKPDSYILHHNIIINDDLNIAKN